MKNIDLEERLLEFGYEEAIEWIEYNTIRALPYMGNKAPIIVKELPE